MTLEACMKKKLTNIFLCVGLCVFVLPLSTYAAAAVLTEIRLGKHTDFSRIVFEFKDDVSWHLTPDNGSGQVFIIFDGATSNILPPVIKENSACIKDLGISQQENTLTARIAVSTPRFQLNPFTINEPFRMVLDITCLEETKAAPAPFPPEPEPILSDVPSAIAFPNTPAEKQESDIVMKKTLSTPADHRALPPEKPAAYQNYLIAVLAVLSLIILGLAAIILFHYRGASEKHLHGGNAKTLKQSEDMLSSIDAEIRQKLRAHDE